MERPLKQRLIGALVLIALAVVFLPMIVKGPAPDSGVADIPMTVTDAPREGFQTRELPLGAPGEVPAGGVAGMEGTPGEAAATAPPDAAASPATAAGAYAVNFGHYANSADADRMVAALAQSRLSAYAEPATLSGRSAWRVRIGPFATRAEAEDARLGALQVSDKVNASVVALDAVEPQAPPAPATPPQVEPAKPVAEQPARPATKTAPPAPSPPVKAPPAKPEPKPAAPEVGFAVQLGAFADAAAATALRDRARAAGLSAFTETVKTDAGMRTRVRIGPVADRAAAEKLREQAQAKLGIGGIVRPHP